MTVMNFIQILALSLQIATCTYTHPFIGLFSFSSNLTACLYKNSFLPHSFSYPLLL